MIEERTVSHEKESIFVIQHWLSENCLDSIITGEKKGTCVIGGTPYIFVLEYHPFSSQV